MTRMLTIGIASLCAKPGDLAGNLAQLTWAAQQAARAQCDLVLTPEMSATGYGGWPDIVALA
ncbi:MAG: nitrilase-related carbon-nitrogen hydrolase, partial [Roseiflexaceae bacterium]